MLRFEKATVSMWLLHIHFKSMYAYIVIVEGETHVSVSTYFNV